MLESVRQCINNTPDIVFADFYQQYILNSEHQIVDYGLDIDKHRFTSIDNINDILAGLNIMTEELKHI